VRGRRGRADVDGHSWPYYRCNLTPLYPLFLKLDGKTCVVVGGGPIAAHKAEELYRCGAKVRVISPQFDSAFEHLQVERILREFADGDTRGAFVVIAATGDETVDTRVSIEAKANGALVNAVDNVEASGFYTGGVVRRGPLTVSIGTSGASPALARRVRMMLDQFLPQALGPLAEVLGAARPRLLERFPNFKERAKLLDEFVDRAVAKLTPSTTKEDIERWVNAELLAAGGEPPPYEEK
jgi:siroheme synthase-like protein